MDFDASTPTDTHAANGSLTSDGVFQYQYDAANQLTNVVRTADGARVLSVRYDALGRRVEAIRGDGSVERYVYFPGSFLVLAVLDGTNAVKEIYTRGPDLSGSLDGAGGIGGILACTYASGATYCSHADIMGNVIALTDASGSVAATFRYTPFGQFSARTGTLLPRYLFSSKEFDRTADLYYYGYRYYAPRLGRWMTRDPLEEDGGENLHEFSLNNPCSYVDSVGEMSFKDLAFSSIGWDKAWPFPPDGQGIPVGLGGARIQVFVYSTGSYFGCCNRKTGKKEQWFSVTLGMMLMSFGDMQERRLAGVEKVETETSEGLMV